MACRFYAEDWDEFVANCGFSDNELEIIPFLRRGWAQADIAAELCISPSTLKRRVKRIKLKIINYTFNCSKNPKS